MLPPKTLAALKTIGHDDEGHLMIFESLLTSRYQELKQAVIEVLIINKVFTPEVQEELFPYTFGIEDA